MKCKFCKKEFKRESTLLAHVCEQKRRWNQRDERAVQIAFHAWLEFMSSVKTPKKKPYTYEDFMKSSLYSAFVRYGNYLKRLKAIEPAKFTAFLIKHGVKLSDWTKDYPYNTYLKDIMANESPDRAIERSLNFIQDWADENDRVITDFYSSVNTNQATKWILEGRISPWLLFCSSNSDKLLERMSPEQLSMIDKFVGIARWKTKIKDRNKEVKSIRTILYEAGI